jgi:hypothetical protein
MVIFIPRVPRFRHWTQHRAGVGGARRALPLTYVSTPSPRRAN